MFVWHLCKKLVPGSASIDLKCKMLLRTRHYERMRIPPVSLGKLELFYTHSITKDNTLLLFFHRWLPPSAIFMSWHVIKSKLRCLNQTFVQIYCYQPFVDQMFHQTVHSKIPCLVQADLIFTFWITNMLVWFIKFMKFHFGKKFSQGNSFLLAICRVFTHGSWPLDCPIR